MTDKEFIFPFYAKVLLKPRGFLLGDDIPGKMLKIKPIRVTRVKKIQNDKD